MDALLERLKLVDYLTMELPIGKNTFVQRLKMNVDPDDNRTFFPAFEACSSSTNEYKGTVTSDSFKIRRRIRLFEFAPNLVVAKGNFRQNDNSLVIESRIKGLPNYFIYLWGFLIVLYVFFLVVGISSDSFGDMKWFVPIFLAIHAVFMLGIPYFLARRAVSRMKYELEREFYYMTKD